MAKDEEEILKDKGSIYRLMTLEPAPENPKAAWLLERTLYRSAAGRR